MDIADASHQLATPECRQHLHGVVVIGNLLRRHCLMIARKLQTGPPGWGKRREKVYRWRVGWISDSYIGANQNQGTCYRTEQQCDIPPALGPSLHNVSLLSSELLRGDKPRGVHVSKNSPREKAHIYVPVGNITECTGDKSKLHEKRKEGAALPSRECTNQAKDKRWR